MCARRMHKVEKKGERVQFKYKEKEDPTGSKIDGSV
jgi:hypothetical protein